VVVSVGPAYGSPESGPEGGVQVGSMGLTTGAGALGLEEGSMGSAETPPLGAIRRVKWSNIGRYCRRVRIAFPLPFGRIGESFGLSW